MRKLSIFFSKKKLIKWGIVPLILLSLWIFLSILYYKNTFGISSLTTNIKLENTSDIDTTALLKDESISGEFRSSYNYLGIILVRFNTYFQINDDIVIFRIKEKNHKEWYYQNMYKVDQFQPNELFTFGFPVISNSMGKTYIFEIISTRGERGDAVAISGLEPQFVAKYAYPRSAIASSPNVLLEFITTKIINSLSNVDFVVSSITYALPFVFYILYISFKKYLTKRYLFAVIPFTVLLLESFFVNNTNDFMILVLLFLICMNIYVYKLGSSVIISFSILFLLLAFFAYSLNFSQLSENFTMWAYLLLSIAIVMQIIDLRFRIATQLGFSDFLKKIQSTSL